MTSDEMDALNEVADGHGLERAVLVRKALEIVVADPALLRREVQPIRLRRDYTAVGRKTFLVGQFPDGTPQPDGKLLTPPVDKASEGRDGAVVVTLGGVTYRGFINVPDKS